METSSVGGSSRVKTMHKQLICAWIMTRRTVSAVIWDRSFVLLDIYIYIYIWEDGAHGPKFVWHCWAKPVPLIEKNYTSKFSKGLYNVWPEYIKINLLSRKHRLNAPMSLVHIGCRSYRCYMGHRCWLYALLTIPCEEVNHLTKLKGK